MGVLTGGLPLGIITGLTAEARLARPLGMVEAGGGRPEGAEAAAERLAARGVRALVSFGLAGGLDPGLAPGVLVIPASVLAAGECWPADEALTAWLGGGEGALLAGTEILATVPAKRAAFAASGAAAVDLESGAVARVAARNGLPFAVLRAVCDPATRALPPAALAALDARGAIGLGRVAGSVLAHPAQIPALLALARDAGRARQALRARVRELAAGGGC